MEKINDSSYLTMATWFMMLVESKADYYEGEKIANARLLAELAKIFKNKEDISFSGDLANQQTTKFRSGKAGTPEFMEFRSPKAISEFDARVKNNRAEVMKKVASFVDDFIYVDRENPWLIYALFEIALADKNIDDDVVLYIDHNGEEIKKVDLKTRKEVSVPAVIIGFWSYILHRDQEGEDREKIKYLYNEWTVREGNGEKKVDRNIFSWAYEKIELVEGNKISSNGSSDGKPVQFTNTIVKNEIDRMFVERSHYGGSFGIPPTSLHELYKNNDIEGLRKELGNYTRGGGNPYLDFLFDYVESNGHPERLQSIREYLDKVWKKYEKKKTLLYEQGEYFYNFFVPNNIKKSISYMEDIRLGRSSVMREPTTQKLLEWSKAVFITGTGGLGKSMMMRHFLLDAVKNYEIYDKIPVFVELKRYSDEKYIEKMAYESITQHGIELEETYFMEMLRAGKVTLLLDGMDEIKTRYKLAFEEDMEGFLDRFSNAQIIISSRGHENFMAFGRIMPTELLGFTLEQAICLIEKLDFRPDEPETKEEFLELLKTKLCRTHRDFIEVPLLLTIMLMTFERYSRIPDKMHVFYKEAYETLAFKHDATKGAAFERQMKTKLDSDEFEEYLAEFCARSYQKEDFEYDDFMIRQYFESLNIVKAKQPKFTYNDFIEDLKKNLCLLQESDGKYEWTHRTFQEYFTALYFSKQKDKYLYEIGRKVFNKRRKRSASDMTFAMLYDMKPSHIEEYLLLPYMEDLINIINEPLDFSEFMDEDEIEAELKEYMLPEIPYWRFIERLYGDVRYYEGDVTEFDVMRPNEFLYRFIISKYKIEQDLENIELPSDDGLEISTFGYYHPNCFDPEEEDIVELTCIEEMDEIYISNFGTPDVEGSIYEFCVSDIIESPDDWWEFIDPMIDEKFPLMVEYRNFLKLYDDMKKKYEAREEDNSLDIFDLFD